MRGGCWLHGDACSAGLWFHGRSVVRHACRLRQHLIQGFCGARLMEAQGLCFAAPVHAVQSAHLCFNCPCASVALQSSGQPHGTPGHRGRPAWQHAGGLCQAVRSRRHQPLGAQARGGGRAAAVAGRAPAGSCPTAPRPARLHGRAWPGWHARGTAWPPWMARWRCCPHWRCDISLEGGSPMVAWPGDLAAGERASPSEQAMHGAEARGPPTRTPILDSSAGHACWMQAWEGAQVCALACMLCCSGCARAGMR